MATNPLYQDCEKERETLTEFAHLSFEDQRSTSIISWILGKKGSSSPSRSVKQSVRPTTAKTVRPSTLDTVRPMEAPPTPETKRQSPSTASSASEKSLEGSEEQVGKEAMIHRTFDGVLRRLGKLMDRKTQVPKVYKDSDFKQYWMPDNNCRECYECGDKFNTFRRRHHCRICGQIFCSRCCNQAVPGKIMGYTGDLRACTYCCKIVLTYFEQVRESTGDLGEMSENLEEMENNISDPAVGLYDALRIFTSPQSKRRLSHSGDDESVTPIKHSSSSRSISLVTDPRNSGLFDKTPQQDFSNIGDSFYQERRYLIEGSAQLRELWLLINHPEQGLEFLSHRYRLRTYPNCITGRNLVTWLIRKDKASSREQAVAIGQALLDAKWLECCSLNEQIFKDEYVLYKAGETANSNSPMECTVLESSELEDDHEPQWVRTIRRRDDEDNMSWSEQSKLQPMAVPAEEIGDVADETVDAVDSGDSTQIIYKRRQGKSTFYTNSRFVEKESVLGTSEVNIPKLDISQKVENMSAPQSADVFMKEELPLVNDTSEMPIFLRGSSVEGDMPDTWRYVHLNQLGENNGEKQAYEILVKAFQDHTMALIKQLLSRDGLSLSWADVIMKLTKKVSETVRPYVKTDLDDMDIRQYVHIKKIPGGNKSNCTFVNGVVFSKNVAHKKMSRNMQAPKILLLGSSIEYQRKENKLTSLEPQVLQEHEFLKKSVAKIAKLQPNLLIVEKTVSNLAQAFVLDSGITLMLNVKPSVIERISRLAQADIVPSIDSLVGGGRLGVCGSFRIQNYQFNDKSKPLVFLEGCPQHLGCSVILEGGSLAELKKIKSILRFMIYVGYHSLLEMSLLMDEFAQPPLAPILSIPGLVSEGSFEDGESHDSNAKPRHVSRDNETILHGGMTPCGRLRRVSNSETVLEALDHYVEERLMSQLESIHTESEEEEADACDGGHIGKMNTKAMTTKDDANFVNESMNASVDIACDTKKTVDCDKDDSKSSGVELNRAESLTENLDAKKQYVTDASDPLHSYQRNQDDSIFETNLAFAEEIQKHCGLFKKALSDIILSSSPNLVVTIPYLETEEGMRSPLRKYFPSELFWSEHFNRESGRKPRFGEVDVGEKSKPKMSKVEVIASHPFVLETITEPITSRKIQALLADFRARGGTIRQLSAIEVREKRQAARRQTSFAETKSEEVAPVLSTGLEWERKIDCLNPEVHQQLSVLFSSYCHTSPNAPYPCVSPWVVAMDYYGRNDITLGGFLERYCFRESYNCPSETCNKPMLDHIRRFVHDTSCIHIMLKKVKSGVHVSERRIYMWSWCKKCKQVTPVVPMSQDTWSISFAKYLELRFHGNMYGRRASANPCVDSIHHDHYQYFGFKNTVAAFKYSKITLREVVFPPPVVSVCSLNNQRQKVIEECRDLSITGYGVYSHILEYLIRIQGEVQPESPVNKLAAEYVDMQKVERAAFRDQIETLNMKLTTPVSENADKNLLVEEEYYECVDIIASLKKIIADAVILWNQKLSELQQLKNKLEKEAKNSRNNASSSNSPQVTGDLLQRMGGVSKTPSVSSMENILESGTVQDIEPEPQPEPKQPEIRGLEAEIADAMEESLQNCLDVSMVESERSVSESTTEDANCDYSISPGLNVGMWPTKGSVDEDTFIMCKHRETAEMPANTSSDNRSSGGFTETTESSVSDKSITKSVVVSPPKQVPSGENSKKQANGDDMSTFQDSGKVEKRGFKSVLSNLLSVSGNNPLVMPFPNDEHHLLKSSVKLPVIIYDKEPSSIIAYALSSADYEVGLQELKRSASSTSSQHSSPGTVRKVGIQYVQAEESMLSPEKKLVKRSSVLSFFKKDSKDSVNDAAKDTAKVTAKDTAKVERDATPPRSLGNKPLNVKYTPEDSVLESPDEPDFSFLMSSENSKDKIPNQHIELQFGDTECGGNSKYYCKVYFAEQFRKLRKSLFPAGEARFIRSISRCVDWLAKGGKSGATFCKSKDDRFILKQMSLKEIQSFLEFAPHYFQYITKANSEKAPTVLGKIFGVYRIGFRNSLTGIALKQDLLVMENLFYGRTISQKFDLKGSMRNRLVNPTSSVEPELVLLDENIVRVGLESPLYIRPHSKLALSRALHNDTEFLSKHFVMDYSLLVGIDEERKELVTGIIDYIRTFTWDKKLEMVVKSSYGMIVSSEKGKMPTVVSPEIYRNRFLEAMDSYFLMVPDRWNGLGNMDTSIVHN